MSSFLPKSVRDVIEEFSKLPGIGPKSAQRLTMFFLHSPDQKSEQFASAVFNMKKNLMFCKKCWNVSEKEICPICDDLRRNQFQVCVVEEILDVVAIEKTLEFKGVYHVLHGALSPVDGVGPEQLKVEELIARVKEMAEKAELEGVKRADVEVILATNPGLEGETTALYLLKLLSPLGVNVTRIARGLPVGGDLDYADEGTLSKALEGRRGY